MPLHLPLDHLFFPLSAAISPRASEQVVYGSLLLKLLSTTRQRQGMSKKGQETKLKPGWAQSREGTQSEEVLPNRIHT